MQATTNKELEAVRGIHRILEPLENAARGRVIQAVTALLLDDLPDSNAKVTRGILSPPGSIGSNEAREMSIVDFVKARRPTTLSQRLVCLAYYLENQRGIVDITTKQLIEANSEARQPPIGDMGRELSTATRREGLFSDAGRHLKRLSPRGTAVVESLPDQEAVKKVYSDHPFKKRNRKPKSDKRSK